MSLCKLRHMPFRKLIPLLPSLEVLLPINHNFNKICDFTRLFFLIKTQEIRNFLLLAVEKKPFKRASDGAYRPIT